MVENGKLHREEGPAMGMTNGTKKWYRIGELHREDGPAVEWANGDKEWWINGRIHRADGPAIERCNGDKEWWINGKRLKQPPIKLYSTISNILNISNDICSICMDDFKDIETAGRIKCGHVFHINCLSTWINVKKNCPLCRKAL